MEFSWKLAGAFMFGAMLGWNVYFVNRYRKGDIGFGDITTLIGAVGGAAVLALYNRDSELFGAYGVGLGVGFFSYYISLLFMVRASPNFDIDWFLDGRRRRTLHPCERAVENVLGTPGFGGMAHFVGIQGIHRVGPVQKA